MSAQVAVALSPERKAQLEAAASINNAVLVSAEDLKAAAALDEAQGQAPARAPADNEVNVRGYIAAMVVYLHFLSRCLLWGGAWMAIIGFAFVGLSANHQQLDVNKFGSVSSVVADLDSPQGKFFKGFMSFGWLLIAISGFGFFIAPRWEHHDDGVHGADGLCGSSCTSVPMCACSPSRVVSKEEAGQCWVYSLEGRFKMWWQIIAPMGIVLVAQVPVKHGGDHADAFADTIHTACAVFAFLMCLWCEWYQLLVGEKVWKKRFKFRSKLQLGRFVCCLMGTLFILMYVVGGNKMGATREFHEKSTVTPQDHTYKPDEHGNPKDGAPWGAVAFICEAISGMFLAVDYMLLSYTPPSATIVALTHAGWDTKKAQ